MNSRCLYVKKLVTKRDDPNYSQVTGHVPTELATEFGVFCAARRITKSDALEEAIRLLLSQEVEGKKVSLRKSKEKA
ncbi:hypothetical protein H6G96_32555 [Nostoc sp. FACHB-892]|uniref:hypothetical protein n=1 Tax=Nostoc sp. FACHB-892 TaxID=2692843 RepID=UPI00168208C4|nr:hypothetical protein [Nostoc sp. FACHB-892]MBD2730924.1 hypothetical protein [Nostoc sp. FACHB-892]